jgi:Baseplate J-like protein
MAGGIVYLDVDDEITTAASRIRGVDGRRVALVLSYGSRVATSRINFRLLSRDALLNEKQLAVVAGDSATRALAASAGLPVFGSVAEYESSLAGVGEEGGQPATEPPATPVEGPAPEATSATPPKPPKGRRRRTKGAEAAEAGEVGEAGETGEAKAAETTRADAGTVVGAAGMAAGVAGTPGTTPRPNSDAVASVTAGPVRPVRKPEPRPVGSPSADDPTIRFERISERPPVGDAAWPETRPRGSARADHLVTTRPGSRRSSRLPLIIVLAALALVVLVGGVGACVVLPSATIVVAPRIEDLSLPSETVAADPNATEPDAAARIIPAVRFVNDVTVSDTFPATGKRVEETTAEGVIRFSNLDFLRNNTVDAGSVVSTNAGVRFRTTRAVTVPRANLVGLTVFPGRATVNVTAVEPGTSGNVEPNTIVVIPRGEDPQALKVVNPDATTGGTHEEFPEVVQEDVDAAVAALTARFADSTSTIAAAQAANPDHLIFDETWTIGEPTPTVDPATFVGQEIETFDLEMTAQATILTVDPAPVTVIADTLIREQVKPGYELVEDSIEVLPGEPVVTGQSVTFPVSARARQVAVLDANELRDLVLGKPLDTARELLAPYGQVELTAWPDWVSSIPTFPDRVDVRIDEGVAVETPAPSGSTS